MTACAPSICQPAVGAWQCFRNPLRAPIIALRSVAFDVMHEVDGMYASMYVELGTSKSSSTSSPFEACRYRSMTTSFIFQTFFWNDVVRAAVILAGGASFARSAIVVTVGFQLTPFPLSASVSCFHSVPPHFGPGAP